VEKPAGRSDRELEQMMQAFAAAGVPLYVSYYRRYLPRSAAVKEVLRSGRLGPLVSVDYRLAKVPRETTWRLSAQTAAGSSMISPATCSTFSMTGSGRWN
jgi:predicted dehydrogenase